MSTPKAVTLIVTDDTPPTGPAGSAPNWKAPPDGFEEQALHVPAFVKNIFVRKPKDVDLGRLQNALEKAEDEVAALLGALKHQSAGGFHLKSVDVDLSVSAEGSIGVVTAGAEASITLSFERETPPPATTAEA